jgi:tRNA-Thr(GGU) m(6)t(6)A37 methyltransferase TsaA
MIVAGRDDPRSAGPRPSDFMVAAIGRVRGGRTEAVDDDWGASRARIDLAPRFDADALAGLSEFSHVEILFVFDLVPEAAIESGARHPRERADWPRVGIFAQRGRSRPNRLGVSICRLVEVDGTTLTVHGLDAVDGTPVLDIKPVMREFLPRETVRQPAWATALMEHYW